VKGLLPPEVRAIVRPVPSIRLIGVPKTCFWPLLWLLCVSARITGKLRGVIVDNPRSEKRVASWLGKAIPVVRAEESWYDAQGFGQGL
jgi:hypothetical protein